MGSQAPHAYSLQGKVALITGSGRGIGKGIAVELATRGASIVLNYANTAPDAAIKEIEAVGGKAFAIKADVTKAPEVKRLFKEAIEHYGHIDIAMSNSGTESFKPEEDITEEDYDRIFALNTRAQFFVAQAAMINVKEGGRIILTSSIAASMTGVPNHALYAGSKCAVEGFTRSFAKDCGPKRITVNAIAPGGVMSDMFAENAWHYAPGATKDWPVEKLEAGLASVCPLGRVAYPIDIARIVAFLAHEDSEWINGQVLQVNGGGK